MTMQKDSKCNRCGGHVLVHRDAYGWYEQCIECANVRDLRSIDDFGEVVFQDQEHRPVALNAQSRVDSTPRSHIDLTTREKEILELVSAGLRNREIADKLFISENTVKTHLHNVMVKYDFRNRAQASAYIVRYVSSG